MTEQRWQNVCADVTVIMPAYRSEKTIRRALTSVANQTLKPRAVIVVDDGSLDGTYAEAESCRALLRDVEFELIQQPNAGAGAARNRALEAATTKYVAFLDSDDEWLPGKLSMSMRQFERDDYLLVAHDSVEVTGDVGIRLECARLFRESIHEPFVGLYRRGFIDTSTVVARLDAVVAAGGFDESLPNAQDFALWLAILSAPGARFTVFPEVLSRYHRTAGSIMTHVDRRRRCCMIIASRYAPYLSEHPGSPMASLWFRTVAVHREAFSAHLNARNTLKAIWSILMLPGSLVAATARYLVDRSIKDRPTCPDWGRQIDPNDHLRRRLLRSGAWLWVFAAFGVWSLQFVSILPDLSKLLEAAGWLIWSR